jgi:hypothetical protein
METIISCVENRCQFGGVGHQARGQRPSWEHVGVSNRRRTPADRAQPRTHTPTRRSRPFGGRARGGPRSYAVLKRLHAMPRWAIPVATVVLVLVGMSAGQVVGGLCLAALTIVLGWLAFLAWPELTTGGRVSRMLVLGMLTGVTLARLLGVWD